MKHYLDLLKTLKNDLEEQIKALEFAIAIAPFPGFSVCIHSKMTLCLLMEALGNINMAIDTMEVNIK